MRSTEGCQVKTHQTSQFGLPEIEARPYDLALIWFDRSPAA
jgi:hypothetical protein